MPEENIAFSRPDLFNSGDGSFRASPTVSEDFYDQSAQASFERSVREGQGAIREELSKAAIEVSEAEPNLGRRTVVTITDRGDITVSIREDFARSIFHEA